MLSRLPQGTFAAFVGEGRGAFAAFEIGSKSSVGRRLDTEDENDGPVRRNDRIFHRRIDVENPRCLPRSSVSFVGKPVVLAGRRRHRLEFFHGGPQRSPAPLHAGGWGQIRLGGMNPSCLKRPLTRAGRHWKEKEADVRGGNGCWRILYLARFRFARTGTKKCVGRPAERSVSIAALA